MKGTGLRVWCRRSFAMLVVLGACWGQPPEAAAQRTVKVESQNYQYKYQRTRTSGGVRLVRQLSRDACVEGRTWGFDRNGIWVDRGCRAEFAVGVAEHVPPPTGRLVTVESENWERTRARVSTRGGVRLHRQLSRDACVEGRTWGFDRNGIWVDRGCRAEFEIGGASAARDRAPRGQIVRVESENWRRATRRVSTRGGVRLHRQLSRDACVAGRTWGFDRNSIWVDRGCRAEFIVGR